MKIWRLESKIEPKYLCIRSSLIDSNLNFNGEVLPNDWVCPPYTILGGSKKLPDHISWFAGAPIVTERFLKVTYHLIGDCVQFLPFDTIKGQKTFAMNVTHIQENILDIENSEITCSDYGTDGAWLKKVIFKNIPLDVPPIFKLAEQPTGDIYVNEAFCKIVVEHQLTGICLSDPSVDSFKLIIRKQNRNIYPGVPE